MFVVHVMGHGRAPKEIIRFIPSPLWFGLYYLVFYALFDLLSYYLCAITFWVPFKIYLYSATNILPFSHIVIADMPFAITIYYYKQIIINIIYSRI